MIKIKLEAIPDENKNRMNLSVDTQSWRHNFFFIVMKSGMAPLIATAMSRSKTKKDRVYKASESIITSLFRIYIYKCIFKE